MYSIIKCLHVYKFLYGIVAGKEIFCVSLHFIIIFRYTLFLLSYQFYFPRGAVSRLKNVYTCIISVYLELQQESKFFPLKSIILQISYTEKLNYAVKWVIINRILSFTIYLYCISMSHCLDQLLI